LGWLFQGVFGLEDFDCFEMKKYLSLDKKELARLPKGRVMTKIKRLTPTEKKGLVVVITGNGKGKTTTALGIAVRACGHRMRVSIIQFMKGDLYSGEWDGEKKHWGQVYFVDMDGV